MTNIELSFYHSVIGMAHDAKRIADALDRIASVIEEVKKEEQEADNA